MQCVAVCVAVCCSAECVAVCCSVNHKMTIGNLQLTKNYKMIIKYKFQQKRTMKMTFTYNMTVKLLTLQIQNDNYSDYRTDTPLQSDNQIQVQIRNGHEIDLHIQNDCKITDFSIQSDYRHYRTDTQPQNDNRMQIHMKNDYSNDLRESTQHNRLQNTKSL